MHATACRHECNDGTLISASGVKFNNMSATLNALGDVHLGERCVWRGSVAFELSCFQRVVDFCQ
jgi:hypothetical protein